MVFLADDTSPCGSFWNPFVDDDSSSADYDYDAVLTVLLKMIQPMLCVCVFFFLGSARLQVFFVHMSCIYYVL